MKVLKKIKDKAKNILKKIKNKIYLFVKSFEEKEEKMTKRQKELFEDYKKGKFLQVDNKKDNKEYFKSLIKNDK